MKTLTASSTHLPEICPSVKAKIRILVAEDDGISRELLCRRLERWNYEVVVTKDGAEAMAALLKEDAPSLAILDWMMPGMDGPEICRRVRENGRSIYLILLTALNSAGDIAEGRRAGADDHLAKPLNKHDLHTSIAIGLGLLGRLPRISTTLSHVPLAPDAHPQLFHRGGEPVHG
jgi:CheY-like chemotaxis protein